jgi:hypothetical protein
VRAPGGCSGESPKGLAATRTQRRGHVAGSTRTARPWHGHGEAGHARMARQVGSRGMGAHARARVLASQGRGVALPCAGHRHPRPAARRGGREATAATGITAARWVLHEKTARRPEGNGRSYGWATEGSSASPAVEGERRGTAAVELTGGAEGGGARCGGEVMPWRGGAGPGSTGPPV